jgi:ribose transport system ATP-binding protein
VNVLLFTLCFYEEQMELSESKKPVLEVKGINKSFPGVQALKTVSFFVRQYSIHGLVGENGAGKSTLIKILAGVYQPEKGEIKINGAPVRFANPRESLELGISTIYQELSVIDDLTVAQDLFFGEEKNFSKYGLIRFKKMNENAQRLLHDVGFELDPSVKVRTLSVSEKQQLEIAKAISRNAKIILMDEPTSALSDREVGFLFNDIAKIKQKGVSIIYISHHLDEIFNICDYVTILRDGEVVDTLEVQNTSGFKEEIVNKMVGRRIAHIRTNRTRKVFSDEKVLDIVDYSTKTGVKAANLSLHLGEVLGIYGGLGSKRTELFKSLFTGKDKISGKVILKGTEIKDYGISTSIAEGIGFLPEDKKEEGLFLNLAISRNIPFILYDRESRFGFLKQKTGIHVSEHFRKLLDIKTPSIHQIVTYLSGGNQQKVVLAKLLAAKCEILILDEPLIGIDVGTKNEILDIINNLANEGKSIVVISSELPELLRISDRILIIRNGTVVKEMRENFDEAEIIAYAVGGRTA